MILFHGVVLCYMTCQLFESNLSYPEQEALQNKYTSITNLLCGHLCIYRAKDGVAGAHWLEYYFIPPLLDDGGKMQNQPFPGFEETTAESPWNTHEHIKCGIFFIRIQ